MEQHWDAGAMLPAIADAEGPRGGLMFRGRRAKLEMMWRGRVAKLKMMQKARGAELKQKAHWFKLKLMARTAKGCALFKC